MASDSREIDDLISQSYVPSALERKKSLLMYLLRGILISLTQRKMTKYEFFHCKQAMGWRVFFFLFLIPSIIMMFLPYVKVLPALIYLVLLSIWVIFAKQAWDGRYTSFKSDKVFLPLFLGIGGWVVDMFSLEIDLEDTSVHNNTAASDKSL